MLDLFDMWFKKKKNLAKKLPKFIPRTHTCQQHNSDGLIQFNLIQHVFR